MKPFIFTVLISLICTTLFAKDLALLVGVSEYPHLPKDQWLKGPVHDVELVHKVFTSKRFGYDSKNITRLAGWPAKESERPTRANIRKAFADLAKNAGEGDQVFILMSGHGSQQPANPDPDDLEPDGLDEVFLPADTKKWDEKSKTITGAIIDDEVREWTEAIRAKGAFVWIVFDSCHSGTMTRGMDTSKRVNRRVDPSILVPSQLLETTLDQSGFHSAGIETNEFSLPEPKQKVVPKGGLVAMYAAQSVEPTFEIPLPLPTDENHGLFTFTMMKILTTTEKALSYRELAETVSLVYHGSGIFQPTPLIEGPDVDRRVLGRETIQPKAPIRFTGRGSLLGFEVDSGALLGLKTGSYLEVFPPAIAEKSNQPLGMVKVVAALPTTAFVVPAEWNSRKPVDPQMLGVGCRAELVYEELGLNQLKVVFQSEAEDGEVTNLKLSSFPDAHKATLKELLSKTKGGCKFVSDPDEADWVLRLGKKDSFTALPAGGWSKSYRGASKNSGQKNQFTFGSIKESSDALKRIARARQLVNIAANQTRSSVFSMKVDLVRFKSPSDLKGEVVKFGKRGRVLHPGEEIAFRITNKGRVTIDVTLLFVDSGYGITSLFPESGTIDDNRIPPNGVLMTPRLEVTSDSSGLEQVAALGVRAGRNRVNFSCLEQATIEQTRGEASLESPLGQLLKSAVYSEGTTRGLSRSASANHATQLISWITEAAE